MSESRDPTEGQGSAFFELYDLKVEVTVLPEAQVLRGARERLGKRRFERSATTAMPPPNISR